MTVPVHGGRIIEMEQDGKKLLDLSASINPWGPPPVLHQNWETLFRYVSVYPPLDWSYYQRDLSRLSGFPPENILPCHGATQGIYLLARYLPGQEVVILEPCFTEYARAFHEAGKTIGHFLCLEPVDWNALFDFLKKNKPDILVLGNPGNPLGMSYPEPVIKALEEWCHSENIVLIIDEAFQEFIQDQTSVARETIKREGVFVVRSLTKYYALAGLRGGFLLGTETAIDRFLAFLEPWSINAILAAALHLLAQSDLSLFHAETRKNLLGEKKVIEEAFCAVPGSFLLFPSLVNYYTIHLIGNPEPWYAHLENQGIVVRSLADFWGLTRQFFRFAVRNHEENARFIEVVRRYVENT
ncbi:MAG: aminotransferase class I/II-fold pyridoxal phosphate-dependent enzyme [Candidatus Atribacteria bacterium]|nr:aminotransferase class I/II-fold pyridoxal phosphate-dependent enzyme [Candidatus Atribacteria bacterium]